MKGKKKIIIISAIILVVLVGLVIGGIFILNKDDKKENDLKEPITSNTETPPSPAKDTETLIEKMEKAETTSITADKIEFSENADVKEGELIAVWIYSEPKFLGYFKVVLNDGKKVIEGLEEALAKIDIEPGEHNIALVKEDGKDLGYMDVKIEKEGIKPEVFETTEDQEEKEEQTTKTIKVNESINYSTTKQEEVNMKRGTTQVVTAGVKGTKEVTYEVIYDANGKELSRKKVSEKVIKNPVNEVIKVGTSDYNINTDKETGSLIGFMCLENQTLTNPDGGKACDDSQGLKSFSAISINDKEIVVAIEQVTVNPIPITNIVGLFYKGTYQGTTYYFDGRGGGGGEEPLTTETFSRYNLACGQW